MLAGKIRFTFSNKLSCAEIYDSLKFVDVENLVKKRKSAPGGNLFFWKRIISKIGYFPEETRSGGDMIWTRNATDYGYKMIYSKKLKYHAQQKNVQII